jgi:hypothetical protein
MTPDDEQAIYEAAIREHFQALSPQAQARVLDSVHTQDQLRVLFGPTPRDTAFLRSIHISPE